MRNSKKQSQSRDEKMSQIQEKLENGVREIFESEKYKDYINTMSRFPRYSINNCILIASQKPDASLVCGFRKWQSEFNRAVNRGEKGIMILAPMKCKADVEEQVLDEESRPKFDKQGNPVKEKVTREYQTFRPVYVFDVSQTDGDPIPSLATQLTEDVDAFENMRDVLMEVSPVPITFEPIDSGANGYYAPASQRIVVKEGLPQLQTIKTMIHEIGHATLGHGGKKDKWDRETKEVQAESVAYWVTQMMGLDTSDYSFGYISGWSKDKEVSELKENLELIKTTADQIARQIEAKLQEKKAQVNEELENQKKESETRKENENEDCEAEQAEQQQEVVAQTEQKRRKSMHR